MDTPADPSTTPPVLPSVKPAVAEGRPQAPEPIHPHLTFWQQPWVQNVLPFATSLMLHIGIIVIGYVAFKTAQTIYTKVVKEQVVVPDAALAEQGPPGGIVNPGLGGDPNRRAEQNIDDSVTKSDGWAMKKGEALQASLAGGGAGDTEGETTIGIGPNSAFGKGSGTGSGKGDGFGIGDGGDGSGVLAPFGTPGGGGGIGPKAPFAGMGGNAHKVVYLCDCSGSMRPVFAALRDQLKTSVGVLVPGQFFNVIFFNDSAKAFNPSGLVAANPNSKAKLYDFVDSEVEPRSGTDPTQGIQMAFDNKPELMYVLTDGFDNADPAAVHAQFQKLNADKKVKINTILLMDGRRLKDMQSDPNNADKVLVDLLKQIASENGGKLNIVDKDKF